MRRCASCARAGRSGRARRRAGGVDGSATRAPPELAGRVVRALAANAAPTRESLAASRLADRCARRGAARRFSCRRRTSGARIERCTARCSRRARRWTASPPLRIASRRFARRPGARRPRSPMRPDGSWYLIVVHDASKALGVAWMHDGRHTMLGRTVPRGSVAMLYLTEEPPHGQTRAHGWPRGSLLEADLSWQKTTPNRPGARSG